jgi:hypothetical protein
MVEVVFAPFGRYPRQQGKPRAPDRIAPSSNSIMTSARTTSLPALAVTLMVALWLAVSSPLLQAGKQSAATTATKKDDPAVNRFSRGQKLVLKDGSFQLVRSYERHGERVKYFSVERNDWEEIPTTMVDWDATEKARASDENAEAALVKRVQAQEQAQKVVSVVDVDASLPVGQGAFLPSGEGMFVVEGKSITRLEQVGAQTRRDKKRALEQVISPVPIIPSKHNVELVGAKAKIRVNAVSGPPEFYLREVAPDPDHPTTVWQSSRQGLDGPEVELVRATVKGNVRRLKALRSLMGQPISAESTTVAIQRWEIAKDVYRFTVSEPLPPGEYALAEILADGMNVFVWDFGVDSQQPSR